MSKRVEWASGMLTLVVGLIAVGVVAFGPWTCTADGSSCYGLIWDSLAWLTVGVPTVCLAVIGVGALQTGTRSPLRLVWVRWLAVVGLALPTLLLLIVASYGVVLLPAFVVALWTATSPRSRHVAPRALAGSVDRDIASTPGRPAGESRPGVESTAGSAARFSR